MSVFKFKYFNVSQSSSAMKVGTDAMLLGSLIRSEGKKSGLDIGTGTGVISLMVAQCNPDIQIVGVEIDHRSAQECVDNFNASPWFDRLACIESDFTLFESDRKFDLIYSNPPYYQSRLENSDKRISVAKHEANLPMTILAEKCSKLSTDEGEVWLIVPYTDLDKWIKVFEGFSMNLIGLIAIAGKEGELPNRAVITFSKKSKSAEKTSVSVRQSNGDYTVQYKALTKEFHFNKL